MKAKKFVAQIKEMMSVSDRCADVFGNIKGLSDRRILINLRVCLADYVRVKTGANPPALGERFALKPVAVGEQVTLRILDPLAAVNLPTGYKLVPFTDCNDTDRHIWTLTRRGHEIGIVYEDVDDGGSTFGEQHGKLECGHDCIDTFQQAVDSLIDNHNEYLTTCKKK